MNTQPNELPCFVTCPCQNCNGRIEFDATGFEKGETRNVECPHCHLETVIFVQLKPKPVAPKPAVEPLKSKSSVPPPKVEIELFHYKIGGTEKGPYTFDQLLTLWNSGQITGDALFRQNKSEDWKPLAERIRQQSSATALTSNALYKLLLKCFCIISLVVFFLPNAIVSIPIFGKVEVSMLDFFTPKPSESASTAEPTANHRKINIADAIDGINKANVGGIICLVAVLGLILHYLLTVAWAVINFGFNKTFHKSLNFGWLFLALQFPILFSIGTNLTLNALKSDALRTANTGGDDSAGAAIGTALGMAFINQISIQPGAVMWLLMTVAILGLGMPILTRQLKPSV